MSAVLLERLKREAVDALPSPVMSSAVPLCRYLSIALQLQTAAAAAARDGQLENSFVLNYRLATFITNNVNALAEWQLASLDDARAFKQMANRATETALSLRQRLQQREDEAAAASAGAAAALAGGSSATSGHSDPFPRAVVTQLPAATLAITPMSSQLDSRALGSPRPPPQPRLPRSSLNEYAALSSTLFVRGQADKAPGQTAPRLQAVYCSPNLVPVFSDIAAPNSRAGQRGIETCGLLCGRVSLRGWSSLDVTHLLIPKQTGGADSCEMLCEDEILSICLAHDLLVIGWIHTHPSQSCFMSSLDLHTHAGYQSSLPEAVAVVVAPRDAVVPWAVYRLTDGVGLPIIQACDLRGFHPHDDGPKPLYERGGHFVLTPEAPLTVFDMRSPAAAPAPW